MQARDGDAADGAEGARGRWSDSVGGCHGGGGQAVVPDDSFAHRGRSRTAGRWATVGAGAATVGDAAVRGTGVKGVGDAESSSAERVRRRRRCMVGERGSNEGLILGDGEIPVDKVAEFGAVDDGADGLVVREEEFAAEAAQQLKGERLVGDRLADVRKSVGE